MDIKKMIEERQKNPTETDKMIDEIVNRILGHYFQKPEKPVKLLPRRAGSYDLVCTLRHAQRKLADTHLYSLHHSGSHEEGRAYAYAVQKGVG